MNWAADFHRSLPDGPLPSSGQAEGRPYKGKRNPKEKRNPRWRRKAAATSGGRVCGVLGVELHSSAPSVKRGSDRSRGTPPFFFCFWFRAIFKPEKHSSYIGIG